LKVPGKIKQKTACFFALFILILGMMLSIFYNDIINEYSVCEEEISISEKETVIEDNIIHTDKGSIYISRDDNDIEYRGMWCDGYKIVNHSEVLALVEFADSHNINVLSPLINGDSDGVFYYSYIYPKHIDVAWNFNPLEDLCIEAHKRGIEVHPWVHMCYNVLARIQHQDWPQVSSGGSPSTVWITPSRPDVREHLVNMVMEIASYPVDGIKMDTIRYGSGSYSYDPYSNQAFADSGYTDRAQWQRDQVSELVKMVRAALNEYKPYLWLGADVWQSYSSWYHGVYQDNRFWTEEGWVDYLQIMGYTTSRSSFESSLRDYVQNKHGNLLNAGPYVYVPGNSAHGSVETEEEGINLLLDQIEIARNNNADGISMFSYKYLEEHPSYGWHLKDGPYSQKVWTPLKEQTVPVNKSGWEFNDPSLREGWELFPRRYDYPLNGEWKVTNAVSGTELVSPLLNLDPVNHSSIEFRVKNSGSRPLKLEFSWSNEKNIYYPKDDEDPIYFTIPPDGEYHTMGSRLDNRSSWVIFDENLDRNLRISRTFLKVVDANETNPQIHLDYLRFLNVPRCQKEWLLLGPFQNVDYQVAVGNLHIPHDSSTEGNWSFGGPIDIMPEEGQITSGKEWKKYSTTTDYVSFIDKGWNDDFNTMYVFSHILSGQEGDYQIRLGGDDAHMMWFNGEMVSHDNGSVLKAQVDNYIVSINVREGLNQLVLKLSQNTSAFGFYLRMTDYMNNSVSDELKFYPVLPDIPAPVPDDQSDGWLNLTALSFTMDHIETSDPDPHFDVTSYWWKIDSDSPVEVYVNDQIINDEILSIEVNQVDSGEHTFYILAQDALGRNSTWGEHIFKVDNDIPAYSKPVSDKDLIGISDLQNSEQPVTWFWSLIKDCPSRITRTEIFIGDTTGSSNIYTDSLEGVVEEYTFDGISTSHKSIYFTVVPVSYTNISGDPQTSNPVVIDRLRPERVGSLEITPNVSQNGRSMESYSISWDPVEDPGAFGDLDRYVLEYTSQNLVEWKILAEVEVSKTSYQFDKIQRSERYRFRIYAVDTAGNYGPVSEDYTIPNLEPTAIIQYSANQQNGTYSGYPLLFTANISYDPDGIVHEHFWSFGDGTFSYEGSVFHTYREEGLYEIMLTVYDDFGAYNITKNFINITISPEREVLNATDVDDDGTELNNSDATDGNNTDVEKEKEEPITESPVLYILIACIAVFLLLFSVSLLFKRSQFGKSPKEIGNDDVEYDRIDD